MNKLWGYLAAIGTALLGLVVLFFAGKKSGEKEVKQEQLEQATKVADVTKKENDKIDTIGDADLRERMRKEFTQD